uniref:Uncharacterized protein n=1 Tax=Panagrolaimus davidi TaxID=227884 RepID=A0A914QQ14_9BILA
MPLFGAQPRTHIANASTFPILAKVDTNVNPEFNLNVSSKVNLSYKDNLNKGIQAGFSVIQPNDYMVFEPAVGLFDGSWFKRATVYITVHSMQGDNIVPICDNYNLKDNSSIIITQNNSVRRTEMGTIWTGIDGINYKK